MVNPTPAGIVGIGTGVNKDVIPIIPEIKVKHVRLRRTMPVSTTAYHGKGSTSSEDVVTAYREIGVQFFRLHGR